MTDYISREALKEYVKSQDGRPFIGVTIGEAFQMMIDEVPAADVVEVKHGEWIKDRLISTGGGTYGVYRCSICEHSYQDVGYGFDYCPNCGAKMTDGGTNDEFD